MCCNGVPHGTGSGWRIGYPWHKILAHGRDGSVFDGLISCSDVAFDAGIL